MVRRPDDLFFLKIEKPISVTPSGDKEQDILAVTRQFALLFEDYIRRYPDQWYMFKTFWAHEDLRRHTGV